ncbi:Beta-xylosidase [Actinomadura sp. RB99]|uniref:glycoside hydrolase family 3 N-terminal domain-containing protein n=1 Tax=Actinomadura sp. RB99 TaxID=2691577 RepID=UPI00168A1E5B|nr:glycoside hydrolase family 3 N-terminal domain-containing protein [Actinomadura sp. RB99]MBD2892580.1 Beta-xylosidase [Actinomadura sp. RB99]
MTLAEKLGQLQQFAWTGDTGPGQGQAAQVRGMARAGRLGSVLNVSGAALTNELQRVAVEESRLGIPLVFGLDVVHGFLTTFPIPLAQAASFDTGVAERDAEVSAREARSHGVHWVFSPMMDVTREPRWGRISEGFGEDSYLTAAFAAAKVRGYQGPDGAAIRPGRVAACAKHFAAYGAVEGGREYNTVDLSESRLRAVHLPPFRAAVDAGAATVMAAFTAMNGVPAHADRRALTGILKDDWGFGGPVVSDWTGVAELVAHGFAADARDAARLALGAGVDMEMVSTCFADHAEGLLADGRLARERLDDAVARVLRLKFRLGLFERPYCDGREEVTIPSARDRRAARRAAGRSMVLLKNDGGLLPLARGARSIALVGPFAESHDLHGAWAGPGAGRFPAVTIAQGVREAAGGAEIVRARGVAPEGRDVSGIPAAVAAVEAADAAVVVVGEPSFLSGEGGSRSDLGLPGEQDALVAAVAATGRPFAVVLVCGRPLALGPWLDAASAVLVAWQPGAEGGRAVADVLFGDVDPGGRLPVSFPRVTGQVPIHYDHESTGRPCGPGHVDPRYGSRYLDLENGPRFAFGHGLSYTAFRYGEPSLDVPVLSAEEIRAGATVEASVRVTNTGGREGDEVVQLYVHDRVASLVQPVRRLRGFRRITLPAGGSTTVRFTLGAGDLGFWTNAAGGEFLVEPGETDVYLGGGSSTPNRCTLTVT